MELRLLRYFLMVAREENITKAAGQLHITQPTLSRQMTQLEEELGTALFQPGRHPLTLTEDGMLLKRRAQEILELADKTERELSHGDQVMEGQIAIGSGETAGMEFLARQIAAFRELHSGVRILLYTTTADNIKERIENGLLDMGLVTRPVDTRKYEFLQIPASDCWCVLVREDSPFAERVSLTVQDIKKCPLILPYRQEVREHLLQRLRLNEETLCIAGYSNLEIKGAVLVRQGVGIFLCLGMGKILDGLRSIPIEPELVTDSVLVWKREQSTSRIASAFLNFVGEKLKSE